MEEQWRIIPFYPDYAVSNLGNFKRVTPGKGTKPETPRKTYINPITGYRNVTFGINKQADGKTTRTFSAHRIVAEVWIPNPNGFKTVDHINGDRGDNRVENLRWASYKQNCAATKIPVVIYLPGSTQKHFFDSLTDAAKFIGGNQTGIGMALKSGKPYKGWEVERISDKNLD